jgi:nucleoside-diphosphate-sugar epimerase
VRLLLDELLSPAIALALRARGHDVLAVSETRNQLLRGLEDRALLEHAVADRRAVVTDNVGDFLACHRSMIEWRTDHYGLVLFSNASFPRHRHDAFIRALVTALERLLVEHPADDRTSRVLWLR